MGLSRRWTFAIVVIAILQFCLFLNHRDITTAHEGRVASSAREMLIDRQEWLIPYSNGTPRVVKPPLAYWTTMAAWKIAGTCDVWLARLPAALCGAIGVLLIMDLGRRVLGRPGDLVCGAIWVSTWFIVDEYRKAMADPYLAFFVMLAVWAWVSADQAAHRRRKAANLLLVLFYLAAGIAALAKGHLVLLHLALAIAPYQLSRRRSPGRAIAHIIGALLMLAIALPWFIYIARHIPDTVQQWQEDAGGANSTLGPKRSAWFHYFANLPVMAAPWSVFCVVGLLMAALGKRLRERRHAWAAIWIALSVLVFTFVPMKKNAYLLPTMPAVILVAAAPIVSALRSRKPNETDRFLFAGHAAAAGIALCATLWFVLNLEQVGLESPGPLMTVGAVTLFLVLGAKSLSPRLMTFRTFAVIALGFALAVHGIVGWIRPDKDNRRSDSPFADAVHLIVGDKPLYLIGGGLREDVLFYLARTVQVIDSPAKLPEGYTGYAIATAEQYEKVLPLADLASVSSDRPADDMLYLMKFPKSPPEPPRDRR